MDRPPCSSSQYIRGSKFPQFPGVVEKKRGRVVPPLCMWRVMLSLEPSRWFRVEKVVVQFPPSPTRRLVAVSLLCGMHRGNLKVSDDVCSVVCTSSASVCIVAGFRCESLVAHHTPVVGCPGACGVL